MKTNQRRITLTLGAVADGLLPSQTSPPYSGSFQPPLCAVTR
jgi:hypothetical protein